MRFATYIRTFPDILEHPTQILDVPSYLLEELNHLFEHRGLILEDGCFIRTFLGLLEHLTNLLENRRAISLKLRASFIKTRFTDFIRTSQEILEHPTHILEVLGSLLEDCIKTSTPPQ